MGFERKGKHERHRSASAVSNMGGILGLFFQTVPDQGEVPLQEPPSQLVGFEEAVAHDVEATPQTLHDVEYDLCLLVPFSRASVHGLLVNASSTCSWIWSRRPPTTRSCILLTCLACTVETDEDIWVGRNNTFKFKKVN